MQLPTISRLEFCNREEPVSELTKHSAPYLQDRLSENAAKLESDRIARFTKVVQTGAMAHRMVTDDSPLTVAQRKTAIEGYIETVKSLQSKAADASEALESPRSGDTLAKLIGISSLSKLLSYRTATNTAFHNTTNALLQELHSLTDEVEQTDVISEQTNRPVRSAAYTWINLLHSESREAAMTLPPPGKPKRIFVERGFKAKLSNYVTTEDGKSNEVYRDANGSAFDYYAIAANYEDPSAKLYDITKARKFSKLAADLGHIEAQLMYAYYCARAEGGNRNVTHAFIYAEHAANAGHSEAKFLLSELYRRGLGCEKNVAKADELLSEAAMLGVEKALRRQYWLKAEAASESRDVGKQLSRNLQISDS